MKSEGIKKAMMPQKMAKVMEKLKENKEKKENNKIDLGKFVEKIAKKQYEADKEEKEEKK